MTVTVDTLLYTADATFPTTDGYVPAGAIILAEVVEGPAAHVTADTLLYSADAHYPTADGFVPAVGASDILDAEVVAIPIPVPIPGGVFRPRRPEPVEGYGYGILPQLEGEAFGAVGVVGEAVGTLPRTRGTADGSIGVAGRSAGQLVIRAAAVGVRGQAGAAIAVIKGLAVASEGAIGVRGHGSGMIVKLEATASGRHDDDEAAVLTFLLAA
jgi:hypothetical protein